jgi:two-component system, cell cycle response regulator
MDAKRDWIIRRVVLTTLASIVASVVITLLVYYVAIGSIEDSGLGLLIATLAPALIAPIGSYQYISLNQRLREANSELRVLSERDSLTHTLNRRTFIDIAEKHLALAERHSYPTSLLVLDFDHFKQVNDRHGHAVGDKVLVQTTRVIQEAIRETDVLARIGGEEFILLLPHTAREGALLLAERIQREVRSSDVHTWQTGTDDSTEIRQSLKVTITMGGATCETSTTNLDEMMSHADKLLYAAKQAGRDRYMIEAINSSNTRQLSRVG